MDTQTITETLNELKELIVSRTHPQAVYVYGSFARAEAKASSDIDILVVKKGITHPINRAIDISANKLTNRLVDIKFVDPADVPLHAAYLQAATYGIKIYG